MLSNTLPKPSKVYFQPWVGSQYGTTDRLRLLILGESHYGPKASGKEFTITLTREYANYEWNHMFWTNIMQAVDGKHYWEIDRKTFWEKVAFYNYIQEVVADNARVAPTTAMLANAVEPFWEVLNQLAPTHILVFSKRLWENLPTIWEQGPMIDFGDKVRETRKYPIAGRYALTTWLPHPSYGFSARYWHSLISKFLALDTA
jgi:hypothetical protein